MNNVDGISIFRVKICQLDYHSMLKIISTEIKNNEQKIFTYATANSLNLIYNNKKLSEIFNQFDYVHPDGVGVYLASKILYGKEGLSEKITGSDFYPLLINNAIKNNWKIFLFGDTEETLKKAIEKNHDLKICGTQNGFNYDDEDVIKKINGAGSQILIVGLGCPKQEIWITENKDKLDANIILAVGDGIKIFAGTKKRGGRVFQAVGLEWLVRLVNNPLMMWQRYLIGIPLFLYRVIKFKYFNKK